MFTKTKYVLEYHTALALTASQQQLWNLPYHAENPWNDWLFLEPWGYHLHGGYQTSKHTGEVRKVNRLTEKYIFCLQILHISDLVVLDPLAH